MKLQLVKDSFEYNGEILYCIRYVLVDSKGDIVKKTKKPLMWLTKEQFDTLKF